MTITNPYYEFDPTFTPGTQARSDSVNFQFQAVQTAFDLLPPITGTISTGTNIFAPETGSANAYVITTTDTRTTNQDGDGILFFATHTNTGSTSIDVDGIGAVALNDWDGTILTGGEIVSGRIYEVRYDATNTRFVISANSDAAVKVAYAQEWAANPEGTLVSVAAGGDGVSDYSALHWAAKSSASALAGIVNTDIVTATPPTNEAVLGSFQIWDADTTDRLMQLGYGGSNTLFLHNEMRGGAVQLSGRNNAGSFTNVMIGDPDGATAIYHAGTSVAQTATLVNGGFEVNNTVTGAGFERALTTSDLSSIQDGTTEGRLATWDQAVDGRWEEEPNLIFREAYDIGGIGSHGVGNWLHVKNSAATRTGVLIGDATERLYLYSNDADFTNYIFTQGAMQIQAASAINVLGVIRLGYSAGGGGQYLSFQATAGATALQTSNVAGQIQIQCASGNSDVALISGTALTMQERAGSRGAIASTGQFWVRTGAPCDPMFTDDAGTSFVLQKDVGETTVFWSTGNGSTSQSGSVATYESGAIATYESGADVQFDDSAELKFGTGGDVAYAFDGTDFTTVGTAGAVWLVTAFDQFRVAGTIGMNEQTTPDGDVAGVGQTWVRDDVPNLLMYTDDAGASYVVAGNDADVGLTADIGSIQGGGVISATYNVYSTVGTIGDAATLPAAFPVATLIYIKNDGANSMDVFPASGDDAGAGTDVAVAVAAGVSALFIATVVDATWTQLY